APGADEAARAGFGERDGEAALAKDAPHHDLHRRGAFAVDVGADALADARREPVEARPGLVWPPVHHDAQRDLREARAERHPPLGGVASASHTLVEPRTGTLGGPSGE